MLQFALNSTQIQASAAHLLLPLSISAYLSLLHTIFFFFFMDKATLFMVFTLLGCSTVVVQCTPKNIFILAGQSNMVGEGGVNISETSSVWDGIIPPDCRSSPQILRLNNDSLWETAQEPLHQGIGNNTVSGIGPGMPFANSILKPGEVIGLVPCAVSGSLIGSWLRGTHYYNRTLARAAAALSNGGGAIRALLWYQGESDAGTPQNADSYKANLQQLVKDLRNDLGSPSLPVILVALATGGDYKDIVREAQLNSGLANVYCVDAQKLKTMPILQDYLHLNAQAQVELGKEMAKVFNNISALV